MPRRGHEDLGTSVSLARQPEKVQAKKRECLYGRRPRGVNVLVVWMDPVAHVNASS